jgi:exodeoxyribonuclease VII small subunit
MSKKKDLTFAEARERLDEILAEVEHEDGDVDQLAARVREAAELIRFCRDRLSAARAQVTQVVAELSAVEQSVAQDAEADERGGADEAEDEATSADDEDVAPDGLPF